MNPTKLKLISAAVGLVVAGGYYFGFAAPMGEHTDPGEVTKVDLEEVTITQGGSSRSYDQYVYQVTVPSAGGTIPLAVPTAGNAPAAFLVGQKVELKWRQLGLLGRKLGVTAKALPGATTSAG